MRWCVVALGLCGCDALFGLDSVGPGARDSSADTSSVMTVTGVASRRYLHLDPASAPVLETAVFPAASPIVARHGDGTDVPVIWDSSGMFSFDAVTAERY